MCCLHLRQWNVSIGCGVVRVVIDDDDDARDVTAVPAGGVTSVVVDVGSGAAVVGGDGSVGIDTDDVNDSGARGDNEIAADDDDSVIALGARGVDVRRLGFTLTSSRRMLSLRACGVCVLSARAGCGDADATRV
jgi:hypothetical protein